MEEERGDVMMTEAIGDGEEEGDERFLVKCLGPLPMRWSVDELRAFLESQGVSFKSAKKKKGMVVGFINFDNSEQVKAAVEGLEGKVAGTKTVKLTQVLPRSFERKQSGALTSSQDNGSEKTESSDQADDGLVSVNSVLKGRTARSAVTPLSHLSYPDQLEHKTNSLKQILKKLTRNGRKACPHGVELPEWIKTSREIGGLPCKFEGIIESPMIDGYRNKCEFSVGYSVEGKPTVGFLLGNFREGVTAVEEPTDCPNVSSIALRYASIFQEVIRASDLPLWNRLNNNGFWRQLTVREGRMPAKTEDAERSVSEVLLMVQVCMTEFEEELVKKELEKMAQAFSQGTAADASLLPLTALVVQDHRGISNVAPSDAPLHCLPVPRKESELISGNRSDDGAIHDYISNLRFQISATAFFQVNTLAAEKLYALAGDWADLGPDTLLFDVCCGTGTIGLTLAHRVGMVVGIELNASAVADAHRNAEINGIKNCRFVCSKAEDVMGSLLKEYLNTSQKDELSNEPENNDEEIKISDEEAGCIELQNGSAPEQESAGSNSSSLKDGPAVDGVPQKDFASKNMSGSGLHFKNVVAIVDPPRVGLHSTVLKALRTHERLKRLVYISCNPESLMANAIELCTPCVDKAEKGKDNRGWRNMSSASLARHRVKSMPTSEPFKPVKAMAVDLFPHTPHCELVMLLER